MKFILAKKLGMSTIYEEGKARNVTLLEAGKNYITLIRDTDKDGYDGVQFGMLDENKSKDDRKVFLKKCEIRTAGDETKSGQELKVDQFSKEEKVAVIGISKGKGNQGVMKRHNFKGSPASHGHRHDHRAPGSIGSAFPERVMKGKKMAGRMGNQRNTVRNMKVVMVDTDRNLLAVEGSVPGSNGSVVQIISR